MAANGGWAPDGSLNVTVVAGASDGTALPTQGNVASGATDSGNPVKIAGVYNSTLPTATTGQRVDAQSDANGSILVLANGRQATGADAIANNSVLTMGTNTLQTNNPRPLVTAGHLFNGTTWDRQRGDTNGALVQGNSASGTTAVGFPVGVGGVFSTAGTLSLLTAGNRSDLQFDARGNARVTPAYISGNAAVDGLANTGIGSVYAGSSNASTFSVIPANAGYVFNGSTWDRIPGNTSGQFNIPPVNTQWSYAAATGGIVNTTTAVTIKTAAGASVRNYVQNIQLSWDSLGAATEVAIRDGASGTVLWRHKIQTTSAGNFSANVFLKGTANTLLEVVTLSASVTGGVFVNVQGFTGP